MAGSVNKVILVGNLGADPEVRNTQSGAKVASFSLATSESWKDQSGQKQERTEWHRVVVFGDGLVNVVDQYVKKGHKLYIEGVLRTRKWQDNQGQDRYTTEVVISGFNSTLTMLSGTQSSGGGYGEQQSSGGYSQQSQQMQNTQPADQMAGISDLDDDIPF